MKVKDIMEQKVARIGVSTTFQEAADLLVLTQASDLIVVDDSDALVGVVSEGDFMRALIPDYNEVAAAGGSMADAFRIFVESGRDLAHQPITRLIIRHPITVSPDDELLAVAAIMIEKMIRRLPVVEDGRFCGTISRADITWAVLSRGIGRS
jgi:CBS domain-containing protein